MDYLVFRINKQFDITDDAIGLKRNESFTVRVGTTGLECPGLPSLIMTVR